MMILRILTAPLLALLTLVSAVVGFLVCVVSAIGLAACVILVLLALVLLVTGQAAGAAVLMALAFLVSPYGLPALAERLSDALCALRNRFN